MADAIIKPDSGNDLVIQNNGGTSKIEVNNDGTIVFTGTSTDLIPSGTKMIFQQTSSPSGWTKVTSSNDVALRVVSGTVGSGGSVAFETAFASHTPTITVATHSLSTAEIPAHSHAFATSADNTSVLARARQGNSFASFAVTETSGNGGTTLSGNAHGHTGSSSSAINLDVSYVDVIIATKD